jgi:hypothetical protein
LPCRILALEDDSEKPELNKERKNPCQYASLLGARPPYDALQLESGQSYEVYISHSRDIHVRGCLMCRPRQTACRDGSAAGGADSLANLIAGDSQRNE